MWRFMEFDFKDNNRNQSSLIITKLQNFQPKIVNPIKYKMSITELSTNQQNPQMSSITVPKFNEGHEI